MDPRVARELRAELLAAIRSGAAVRPGGAWLQLAAVDEERGQLRRALRAYRRAAQLTTGEEQGRAVAGAQRTGGALLAAGHFILHSHDEAQLTVRLERGEEPGGGRAPDLASAAKRAPGLRNRLGQLAGTPPALLATLDAVAECGRENALLPKYADRSLSLELEQHAAVDDKLAPLAATWRAAVLAAWVRALTEQEPETEAAAVLAQVRALSREQRWGDAADALAALGREPSAEPVEWARLADELGDRASRAGEGSAATRLHELALAGYEQYASWATSGGEGLARMVDVNRLLAKLGRPQR